MTSQFEGELLFWFHDFCDSYILILLIDPGHGQARVLFKCASLKFNTREPHQSHSIKSYRRKNI